MPDAKFESGSFSIFGDMTSQNFYLKKGTSHQISYIYPRKMGLTLKKLVFMSKIVRLDPKLTPTSISAIFNQRKFLSFSKLFRRLDEERAAAANPLIDQFC